jgi:FeoB-associated Cys-rich membrane protein
MIETIIILLIFCGSIFYIGRGFYKSFFSKSKAGCAKGCGSCGAIDFDKIMAEQKMENN